MAYPALSSFGRKRFESDYETALASGTQLDHAGIRKDERAKPIKWVTYSICTNMGVSQAELDLRRIGYGVGAPNNMHIVRHSSPAAIDSLRSLAGIVSSILALSETCSPHGESESG